MAEFFQISWNPKPTQFKACFEGRTDGEAAATCCFGLKERRIVGKMLRKVGKGRVSHAFECQIKDLGYFKEAHEVIMIL